MFRVYSCNFIIILSSCTLIQTFLAEKVKNFQIWLNSRKIYVQSSSGYSIILLLNFSSGGFLMGEIYVTGHRNPDTDSIAASIAYANLRNAIGDRQYKAVRIGSVNDETRHILDLLGLDPPEFVKDMRTQVRDLDFDQPPELTGSVPINLAWTTMRKNEVATLPIINDDGTLYGVISAGDIATTTDGPSE